MGYEGGDLLLTALPGQHPGAAQACVRRLWAVAWVVGRLRLVTRERIRGGWSIWSIRCAIQIDVLPFSYLTRCLACPGVIFGDPASPHQPPGLTSRPEKNFSYNAFYPSGPCIWPVHTGNLSVRAGQMSKGPIKI